MAQKIYRCQKCGERLSKRVYDQYDKYCMNCNPQVLINIKTGKTWYVDHNSIGNPILLIDGREIILSPDHYIVTSKFGNEFYISTNRPNHFKNDEIITPMDDFTLEIVELAVKRLKAFRKKVKSGVSKGRSHCNEGM
jgi:hypothetical protein